MDESELEQVSLLLPLAFLHYAKLSYLTNAIYRSEKLVSSSSRPKEVAAAAAAEEEELALATVRAKKRGRDSKFYLFLSP